MAALFDSAVRLPTQSAFGLLISLDERNMCAAPPCLRKHCLPHARPRCSPGLSASTPWRRQRHLGPGQAPTPSPRSSPARAGAANPGQRTTTTCTTAPAPSSPPTWSTPPTTSRATRLRPTVRPAAPSVPDKPYSRTRRSHTPPAPPGYFLDSGDEAQLSEFIAKAARTDTRQLFTTLYMLHHFGDLFHTNTLPPSKAEHGSSAGQSSSRCVGLSIQFLFEIVRWGAASPSHLLKPRQR